MTPARRWLVLVVLLIAAAALVVFDRQSSQSAAIVEAVAPRAKAPAVEASARGQAESMILPIRPRAPAGSIDDAFATLDWSPPPPPPPPKPIAQPPPAAPPLPYAVIGKKLEDGAWQVFLRREERILVVKTLDTIDDAYRVDEIRPPVMTLTYLPLQQRQTLSIGGGE
jgi:hypothetical protein